MTSKLKKGDVVFNHRSWTGLSAIEIREVEKLLGVDIPEGCLLENTIFEGIPNFSKLPPMSRIVFPAYQGKQAVIFLSEENGPCLTVGKRLARFHEKDNSLALDFREKAQGRRGQMGYTFSAGYIFENDEVLVYPPLT